MQKSQKNYEKLQKMLTEMVIYVVIFDALSFVGWQ